MRHAFAMNVIAGSASMPCSRDEAILSNYLNGLLFCAILIFSFPSGAFAMSYGDTVEGAIAVGGEIDNYSFSGASGENVTIRCGEITGNMTARIELFNITNASMGYTTATALDRRLNTTGVHKIQVRANTNTTAGTYSLYLQRSSNPVNSTTMGFGQVAYGTISSYAQIVPYSISVAANDTILAVAGERTETAGAFEPYLELYNSTGSRLAYGSGRIEQKVLQTGTYFVFVSDSSLNGAGTYDLMLQRPNNPVNVTAIGLGNYSEGIIDPYSDLDVYNVTLNVNDTITIRSGKISQYSGTFDTYLDLYNATGSRIAYAAGSITQKVAATGNYFIFVSDNNRNGNGTYSLGIQRVNNPVGASNLSFGQNVAGNINSYARIISYKFAAVVNDTITARAGVEMTWGGTLNPYIEVYNSSGSLVTSSSGSLTQKMTQGGNFTMLLTDDGRNGKGTFSLGLQRVNNPSGASSWSFGATVNGTTNTTAKIDTYTFSGMLNDQLLLAIAELSDTSLGGSLTYNPYVELYNSSGTLIAYSSGSRLETSLSKNDTYCLLVTDGSRDGTGSYEATLQRSNNPANLQDATYNATMSGGIASPSALVPYRINVTALQNVTFCNAVDEGELEMYQELFNSTGTRLTYSLGQIRYTFPVAGLYYMFYSDWAHDEAGTYKCRFEKANISSCTQFDLYDPVIDVLKPQPAEVVESGSSYNITWTHSADCTWQEIRLSTDGGYAYDTVIASNLSLNAYAVYQWNISANLTSTRARIRVIGRDAAGNEGMGETQDNFIIINMTTPTANRNVTYEYDSLNRLTRSSINGTANTSYLYDALGNRLNMTIN